MSNTLGSSSRQHHQDLPAELNDSSYEKHTRRATRRRQERWSQLAQSRPANDLGLEREQSKQQPSRRIQERWNRLKQLELTPSPELEELNSQISRLRELEDELMEKCKALDRGIKETKRRLMKRETQRESLKEITGELAVAQRFLSTADSLSQAEVVSAMEALNEEIFQLTSVVADTIQVERRQLQTEEDRATIQGHLHHWALGPAFLEVVFSNKLQDVLAIQIGWQAILTCWCKDLIWSWDFEDEDVNMNVENIYKRIWTRYDQAVAGRWRSMSLSSSNDPSEEIREEEMYDVIKGLAALPLYCGYIFDGEAYDELIETFTQRIPPLLDQCLKFRRTIREGIISMDIQPYFVVSGEKFNPLRSDLEYEDEKEGQPKEKEGIIACSLCLGLYSTRSSRAAEGKVTRKRRVILKSKAILQETLRDVIT